MILENNFSRDPNGVPLELYRAVPEFKYFQVTDADSADNLAFSRKFAAWMIANHDLNNTVWINFEQPAEFGTAAGFPLFPRSYLYVPQAVEVIHAVCEAGHTAYVSLLGMH